MNIIGDNNKVTLVIAGPFNQNVVKMVSKYRGEFNIVVSTYKDKGNSDLVLFKADYQSIITVTVIESELPHLGSLHNSQNIYYQCFSALKGFDSCQTEFVVKLRSDEYYSNLEFVIKNLSADKVSTNNVFLRDVSYKYFHLSDHIIVGKLELIKSAFASLSNYIEVNTNNDPLQILNTTTPAETKIFLFIFFRFINQSLIDWHLMSEKVIHCYMMKYFSVFDVSILKPYMIKSSVVGNITDYKYFVSNDRLLGLRLFMDIGSLKSPNFLQKVIFRLNNKFKKLMWKFKVLNN